MQNYVIVILAKCKIFVKYKLKKNVKLTFIPFYVRFKEWI